MPIKTFIWSLLPFQSFIKSFFLPIHSSPSSQGCMIIWAERFTARRENNTGMKIQPETDVSAGKTLLPAPPCRNEVFSLSEQNPKREVRSFLHIFSLENSFSSQAPIYAQHYLLIIFQISESSWNQAGVQRNFPWEYFTAFSEAAELALTASDNLV